MSYKTCLLCKFICILDILVVCHVLFSLFILSMPKIIDISIKMLFFASPRERSQLLSLPRRLTFTTLIPLHHITISSIAWSPSWTILLLPSLYWKPWFSILGWNASQLHHISRCPLPFLRFSWHNPLPSFLPSHQWTIRPHLQIIFWCNTEWTTSIWGSRLHNRWRGR